MPPLPDKRNDMIEKRYKIQVDNHSYVLTVRSSDTSILLYIGGRYNYCLECQLFTKDSFMAKFSDISIGDLPHVYHENECKLDQPFLHGVDTTRILYLLISYISNTYPDIKGLTLIDKSYRDCDDGQSVDLAVMYYLLHGKTWYMSVVGADFLSIQDKQKFQKAEESFTSLKNTLSWDEFKQFITVKLPLPETELQHMYTSTQTWQDFFTTLRNKISISKLCIFISPWIKTFWNIFFKFKLDTVKFKFMFSNPELQNKLKYTITENKQTGGKYTRKNKYKMRN